MKILGVGERKYICEIDINEMMTIMGIDNVYDVDEMLQAGTLVDIDRIIKAAGWLRKLDGEHVDRVIRELQLLLVGVEKVKQSASALTLFNKLGEEQIK